jgi:hypothetical protein
MHDPSAPLQKALVAKFKADIAAVGARVYDRPPASAVFPYLGIGDTQITDDDAGCIDGATAFVTVHIWSRAVGAVECRQISDAILAATRNWMPDLSADGFAVADFSCNSARVLADPDGLTTHGILTFEARTERP